MKTKHELFDLATLAKERGFTTKTVSTSYTDKFTLGGKNMMINDTCIHLWLCELQMWLRENHFLYVLVLPSICNYTFKVIDIQCDPRNQIERPPYSGVHQYDYNTYNEALKEGLIEALRLL